MECDICRRGHHPTRLPFLCAVDARNKIYESRMRHLHALLENDALRRQIHELVVSNPSPSARAIIEAAQTQRFAAEDRTTQILEAADKLRDDIKAARDEIQARKAALARRRSDLAIVTDKLEERRTKQYLPVEKTIQSVKFHWSQNAESTASTRSFLCREAASLYGLRRVDHKEAKGLTEYQIGGAPVVDLTDMNSLSPELITTSLGHISHVLMLASYYLSIRLPAEVTLPHRDYPYPTVLNISTSYRHKTLTFPAYMSNIGNPTSPTEATPRHMPKPRPLYLHKPLSQLLKEDPATYAHFIEAIALLSYDVAWLCGSQGVSIGGKNTPDDVFQVGRNLYNLLILQTSTRSSDQSEPTTKSTPSGTNAQDDQASVNWIGRYSHGSMFYPLASSDGTDIIKNFKLPSPTKLADKLKKKLVGDVPAPDWEVLDDDAWKIEDIPAENQPTATAPQKATKSPKASTGWRS